MFLFWNGVPWAPCYDWYSIHLCRVLKSAGVPFVGQSSSGFGIFNIILALRRCCLAIPIYFCILLRFIKLLSTYKSLIFISLIYTYLVINNITLMEFSLREFIQDFLSEYTVNTNSFWDVITNKGAHVDDIANGSSGLPPRLPPTTESILAGAGSQYDSIKPEDMSEVRVHERSFGWVDENGVEVCPVTKEAILTDGHCPSHDSRVCIPLHDDNNPCNDNEKPQGNYDHVLNKYIPITPRQKLINSNRKYYSNYKSSYQKVFREPWSKLAEHRIGDKYESINNMRIPKYIKDLHLDTYEKAHLRELIMNDKHCAGHQRWMFKSRNIDFYKIDKDVRRHLANLRLKRIQYRLTIDPWTR